MTDILSYIWICIFIAGLVLKILTYSDYYYAVSASAIILFLLSLFKIAPKIQMTLFAALTFVCVLTVKICLRIARRIKKGKNYENKFVGRPAIVTEEINNRAGAGSVKFNGAEWRAASSDDEEIIAVGCIVNILDCSGGVLTCEYF